MPEKKCTILKVSFQVEFLPKWPNFSSPQKFNWWLLHEHWSCRSRFGLVGIFLSPKLWYNIEKIKFRQKRTKTFKFSFFAPRSIRLNFLASPRFQELITLNWFDKIGSFSQSPKIWRWSYDRNRKIWNPKFFGQVMAVRAIHQAQLDSSYWHLHSIKVICRFRIFRWTAPDGSVRTGQSVSQLKQSSVLTREVKISLILVPGNAQHARY